MRPLIAMLLIAALFLPFAGTFAYLKVQRKLVRKEVKRKLIAGLERDELVTFRFTQAQMEHELRWVHSKEFEYRGEMYDIVTRTESDSITEMVCWHDREETALCRQLDALVAAAWGNSPQKQDRTERLAVYLRSLYAQDVAPWAMMRQDDGGSSTTFRFLCALDEVGRKTPFPPPEA